MNQILVSPFLHYLTFSADIKRKQLPLWAILFPEELEGSWSFPWVCREYIHWRTLILVIYPRVQPEILLLREGLSLPVPLFSVSSICASRIFHLFCVYAFWATIAPFVIVVFSVPIAITSPGANVTSQPHGYSCSPLLHICIMYFPIFAVSACTTVSEVRFLHATCKLVISLTNFHFIAHIQFTYS